MRAVITAGGRVGGDFAEAIGTNVKALAPFGGTTLLQRAIDAAYAAGAQAVAVVGGDEVRRACERTVDCVLAERLTGAQNVAVALRTYPEDDVLYLSSDLPFVDGAHVLEFLARAPRNALAMPLAGADAYERRFPGAGDHATRLAGERVANASVFLIPRGSAERLVRAAQRAFDSRKNLVAMAILLGPQLLARFAFRRLRIADVERRVAQMLGIPVAAVRDCPPELCFDVDTMSDYRYAVANA